MSNQYYMVLTDEGRALEAAALAGGAAVKLKEFAVSDGTAQVSPAQNALQNEVWRGPINSLTNDPANIGWVVAETHIPPEAGGFSIRELGLITEDGTLFAVGRVADMYKPNIADGTALDVHLQATIALANAENVTLMIDPSIVMATRDYVDGQIVARTRTALFDNLTLYVRQGGDDGHDGLSEATAKATIDGALLATMGFDPRDKRIVIDVGVGSFGGWSVDAGQRSQSLYILGAGLGTVIAGMVIACNQSFSRMTFKWQITVPSNSVAAVAKPPDAIGDNIIRMDPSSSIYALAIDGRLYFDSGVVEWRGQFLAGINTRGSVSVNNNACPVFRAVDNPSFGAFAMSTREGDISFEASTFEGAASGPKYTIYLGGRISARSPNYNLAALLGDQPGIITSAGGHAAIQGLASTSGSFIPSGAIVKSNNIASVAKTATGTYVVTFIRPLGNSTFVPVWGGIYATQTAELTERTVNGFKVTMKINGVASDCTFAFAIFE